MWLRQQKHLATCYSLHTWLSRQSSAVLCSHRCLLCPHEGQTGNPKREVPPQYPSTKEIWESVYRKELNSPLSLRPHLMQAGIASFPPWLFYPFLTSFSRQHSQRNYLHAYLVSGSDSRDSKLNLLSKSFQLYAGVFGFIFCLPENLKKKKSLMFEKAGIKMNLGFWFLNIITCSWTGKVGKKQNYTLYYY